MTRDKLCKNIKKRLEDKYGIKISISNIAKILKMEEDEVSIAIATEDRVEYKWGTIGGTQTAPRPLHGRCAFEPTAQENGGYSWWKKGVPVVHWSISAKQCQLISPKEFFEQEAVRYTSAARLFRQRAGFPEIPEYENLSEEKILELCQKADKSAPREYKYKVNTPYKIGDLSGSLRTRYKQYYTAAILNLWTEELGPIVAVHPCEGLESIPIMDIIDSVISRYCLQDFEDETISNADKLEIVKQLKAFAKLRCCENRIPDLEEMEQYYYIKAQENDEYINNYPEWYYEEIVKSKIQLTPEVYEEKKVEAIKASYSYKHYKKMQEKIHNFLLELEEVQAQENEKNNININKLDGDEINDIE